MIIKKESGSQLHRAAVVLWLRQNPEEAREAIREFERWQAVDALTAESEEMGGYTELDEGSDRDASE